jgi:hypothetical protein
MTTPFFINFALKQSGKFPIWIIDAEMDMGDWRVWVTVEQWMSDKLQPKHTWQNGD